MRPTIILLTAALMAAFAWIVAEAASPAASAAVERAPAFAPADRLVGWGAPAAALAQGVEDETNPDSDDRVPVQVWTVFAAGGAAGVGLVLYLLRLAVGWVKPPPPREKSHH